jgi:hypothetical protein
MEKNKGEFDEFVPAVRNADNDLLGAMHGRGFTVGGVDEVNGHGAEEIHGFSPTRHELIQLVKHWATVVVEIEYFWFCFQQTGSSEIRLRPFAWRRISRIAEALGQEVVDKAVAEAIEEYGKGQDARAWQVFRRGTPEEQHELQEEIGREMGEVGKDQGKSEQ